MARQILDHRPSLTSLPPSLFCFVCLVGWLILFCYFLLVVVDDNVVVFRYRKVENQKKKKNDNTIGWNIKSAADDSAKIVTIHSSVCSARELFSYIAGSTGYLRNGRLKFSPGKLRDCRCNVSCINVFQFCLLPINIYAIEWSNRDTFLPARPSSQRINQLQRSRMDRTVCRQWASEAAVYLMRCNRTIILIFSVKCMDSDSARLLFIPVDITVPLSLSSMQTSCERGWCSIPIDQTGS